MRYSLALRHTNDAKSRNRLRCTKYADNARLPGALPSILNGEHRAIVKGNDGIEHGIEQGVVGQNACFLAVLAFMSLHFIATTNILAVLAVERRERGPLFRTSAQPPQWPVKHP